MASVVSFDDLDCYWNIVNLDIGCGWRKLLATREDHPVFLHFFALDWNFADVAQLFAPVLHDLFADPCRSQVDLGHVFAWHGRVLPVAGCVQVVDSDARIHCTLARPLLPSAGEKGTALGFLGIAWVVYSTNW